MSNDKKTQVDLSRDALRAKIFSNKQFQNELLMLFGVEVEIRQPTLGAILAFQSSDDKQAGLIGVLTNYCYVPGTDELLFEDADADAIMSMPFGDDIMRLNEIIEKLTGGLNVKETEKN